MATPKRVSPFGCWLHAGGLLLLTLLLAAPASAIPSSGLVLWIDATDATGTGTNPASGTALATWADKSGAGHPATQGTATNRPTLVANALGTNPVVRFDGDDSLAVGTLRATTGNLHAFVVSRRSAAQLGGDTYQRLISTSDGADTYDWQTPDWTITSRYDGSGNSLAYGPEIRQASATNGSLKIAGLTIGRDAANGFSRLRGDIAEVLVYTNALNSADIAAVTNYLHAKWLANTNSPALPRPLVGAIRWDAWIGTNSGVGLAVEKALGPQAWHSRLPYFGWELSATQVVVRSVTQANEDRQIAYAQAAGLDYFAFVMYATNDAMTRYGIDLYQASAHRDDVTFCMINQGDRPTTWTNFMTRMIGHFSRTNHVTVLGGRPLMYMLDGSGFVGSSANQFPSWAAYGAAFSELRAATINAGLQNPYLVYMHWDVTETAARKTALGFDAISSYAINGNHSSASYATLDGTARAFWDTQKASGSKVVPNATVGWDRRPRVQNPVPWESWQVPGVGMDKYYAAPTPAEWSTHLLAALDWVRTYPATADANTIVIYAWNEVDEGGWLLPTHTEQTARLAAMRAPLGTATDRDGDQLDDLWEIWSFASTTNANADTDSDRDAFLDRSEFRAGTDPTNAASRLAITALEGGATNTLAWLSVTGRTYRILESVTLAAPDWRTNLAGIAASPPINTRTVATDAASAYWRVEVE
jgi:hypothetical protein